MEGIGGGSLADSGGDEFRPEQPTPATPAEFRLQIEAQAANFQQKVQTAGEAMQPPLQEFEGTMLNHAINRAKDKVSDPDEIELMQLLEAGVDPRGTWGQRCGRSADAQTEEYKNMRQAEKAQFRKDWAVAKIQKTIRTRTRSQSYQRIDEQQGEYIPFSILWQREGGHRDPMALPAAIAHATKCLQMSGPWISINTMTGRLEFLHLKRLVREQFSQCWALYEKAELDNDGSEAGRPPPGPPPPPGSAGIAVGSKTPGEQKSVDDKSETPEEQKSKADKSKKAKADEGSGEKKLRVKSALDIALADAIGVKTMMPTAISTAKSVLESMDVDREWQREKGLAQPLEAAVTNLKDAMDPFARSFVLSDSKQLRKTFPDDSNLTVRLRSFKDTFEILVHTCQYEVQAIVAMHQARMGLMISTERSAKKPRK